jgi:hypothetical protein
VNLHYVELQETIDRWEDNMRIDLKEIVNITRD